MKLGPFNPILLRVVTAGGRRLRHAFTRWGYLGLLILVLLIALVSGNATASSLSELAKASSQVFSAISYVQLGMICLLAPVFCAAAITQERDSRTYNILLATPLTNAQIVLGSLFSRLYYVVALLLSGVPVFAITLLYGGVTASNIALSFAIALSTALFTGSLAIAIAVFRLGSGKTVFWFYVFNAIYLVAVYLVDRSWLRTDATGAVHTTWLTTIHPFLALESVVRSTSYPTPDLSTMAGRNFFVRWYFEYPAHMYVALTTAASVALVAPSAIVLRRIAQRSEVGFWSFFGNMLRRGKEGKGRKARPVWANPVAWREAATRAGFSGRGLTRWMTILVGMVAAGGLLYAYLSGALGVDDARQVLMLLVVVEFSVSLLVATNTSAAAVTKERESQTLDLLLVTPITSRYYIWGKLRGLVSFMLPFAAVPTLTIALVVLCDLLRQATGHGGREWVVWPEVVVELPLLLTVMLAWACMLGLQLSLKWSRTIVAVMASVAVLAGICSVLGVCGFTAAAKLSGFGIFVSAFSPYTALCMLVDPQQIAASAFGPGGTFDPTNPDAPPLAIGRGLMFVSVLVAAVTYCLIVWAMYRSMVKNFDMIIRRQHQ
ncbi:MAG TPA: ABC transporter permease subunit [Phycisphaerae bacterium]|nr:ABC transporter permease subunit [Phycisphaerae bacterium]